MIYIRDEGERLRQGFNIYPLKSKRSKGFKLRIFNWVFQCRYSYALCEWIFDMHEVNNT